MAKKKILLLAVDQVEERNHRWSVTPCVSRVIPGGRTQNTFA
jgi:hypothetical protein